MTDDPLMRHAEGLASEMSRYYGDSEEAVALRANLRSKEEALRRELGIPDEVAERLRSALRDVTRTVDKQPE